MRRTEWNLTLMQRARKVGHSRYGELKEKSGKGLAARPGLRTKRKSRAPTLVSLWMRDGGACVVTLETSGADSPGLTEAITEISAAISFSRSERQASCVGKVVDVRSLPARDDAKGALQAFALIEGAPGRFFCCVRLLPSFGMFLPQLGAVHTPSAHSLRGSLREAASQTLALRVLSIQSSPQENPCAV